ncbi:MAG: hypothetical protein ACJ71G_06360 [Nitrososphaeraceae archaeon]
MSIKVIEKCKNGISKQDDDMPQSYLTLHNQHNSYRNVPNRCSDSKREKRN